MQEGRHTNSLRLTKLDDPFLLWCGQSYKLVWIVIYDFTSRGARHSPGLFKGCFKSIEMHFKFSQMTKIF